MIELACILRENLFCFNLNFKFNIFYIHVIFLEYYTVTVNEEEKLREKDYPRMLKIDYSVLTSDILCQNESIEITKIFKRVAPGYSCLDLTYAYYTKLMFHSGFIDTNLFRNILISIDSN